mmetsp:Transcript_16794/g.20516  ORF Transcript_16794/g.20516 Transcript_16794/m.20516 type:complete len:478 (-) Transcript_16794:205-1638(-)
MTSQDRTAEFFGLCQSLPPPPLNPNSSTSNNNRNPYSTSTSTSTFTQHSTGRYTSNSSNNSTSHSAYDNNPNDPNNELRHFHQTASAISRDIYSTSTLLNELTTLIQTRSASLFVDETSKVNELVLRIKSNIEVLNSKLDAANEVIHRHKRRLGKNSQAGMEVSNLVSQLQEEFVTTTKGFKDVLRVRSDRMKEKQDRRVGLLGDNNAVNGGANTNGANEEVQSLLGNKPKVYGGDQGGGFGNYNNNGATNSMMLNNPSIGDTAGGMGGLGTYMDGPRLDLTSAMLSQQQNASGGNKNDNMPVGESTMQLPRPYGIDVSNNGIRNRYNNNNSISSDVPTYSGSMSSMNNQQQQSASSLPVYTPMDIQRMEEQTGQSQMMQLIPDQTYLRERADAMEAVETNIVELGTIFNKLAVMVNEHSELVTRVEDNVNDASDNITLSLNTLTDTLDNLRSNRALAMKVMGVLVAFIIFFIIFFA